MLQTTSPTNNSVEGDGLIEHIIAKLEYNAGRNELAILTPAQSMVVLETIKDLQDAIAAAQELAKERK